MMKKVISLLVLSAIFSTTLLSSYSVISHPSDPPSEADIYLKYATASPSGRTWYVLTYDMSGKLRFHSDQVIVESIQCWYRDIIDYDDNGYPILGEWYDITPRSIVLGAHQGTQITIHFAPADVPDDAANIAVYGELNDGTTFLAIGPGWMWRKAGG